MINTKAVAVNIHAVSAKLIASEAVFLAGTLGNKKHKVIMITNAKKGNNAIFEFEIFNKGLCILKTAFLTCIESFKKFILAKQIPL